MKINGNLEVLGFADIKLQIEEFSFTSGDAGKIFIGDDGKLKFNNGSAIVTVLDDSAQSMDLITTLGVEWVNPDGTFNPTNLNVLLADFLNDPLDGNSNLYNVLEALVDTIGVIPETTRKYSDFFSLSSTYQVNHNLGQLYCSVTVIEGTSLVPNSEYTVTYDTINVLTITFPQPRNVTILVIG